MRKIIYIAIIILVGLTGAQASGLTGEETQSPVVNKRAIGKKLVYKEDLMKIKECYFSVDELELDSTSRYIQELKPFLDTLTMNKSAEMYVWFIIMRANGSISTYIQNWSFSTYLDRTKDEVLGAVYYTCGDNSKVFFITQGFEKEAARDSCSWPSIVRDTGRKLDIDFAFQVLRPDVYIATTSIVSVLFECEYKDGKLSDITFEYNDKQDPHWKELYEERRKENYKRYERAKEQSNP